MPIAVVVIFNNENEVLVHERQSTKVYPNHIDHVCGSLRAGEDGEQAARREAYEEAGVELSALTLVSAAPNQLNRFRIIYAGVSEDVPQIRSPKDVAWLGWKSVSALEEARTNEDFKFVPGFFEELHVAHSAIQRVET